MEAFSALLAICADNSPVPDEFPAERPVTWSFNIFFDRVWINGWVNNREAGDVRRYRAHYDVIVMVSKLLLEVTMGHWHWHRCLPSCNLYLHKGDDRELADMGMLWAVCSLHRHINTWRPIQDCDHFADGISKRIFLNISILGIHPKGSIDNIPALV